MQNCLAVSFDAKTIDDPFMPMPRADDLQKRFVHDLSQLDLSKACLEDEHADDQLQVHADNFTVLCRAMPLVSLGKGVVFLARVMYVYMTCVQVKSYQHLCIDDLMNLMIL